MFYGLSKFFKNILPKRLFYRALLIVAIPVIVLQLVITFVFFDSLWIKTNKGMTRALVNEIKTFSREDIGQLIELDKERSIDVIITRLRKKIEMDPKNPKFLQTIRGSGYVLWIE